MSLFAACATTGAHDPSYAEFRVRFATENFKLGSALTKAGTDFLKFTKDDYFAKMQNQDPTLVKQLSDFDEVQFGVSPRTFVICVKSAVNKISMCDNSSTAYLDRVRPNADSDLRKMLDEIRGP
jgi:hypothetical protein